MDTRNPSSKPNSKKSIIWTSVVGSFVAISSQSAQAENSFLVAVQANMFGSAHIAVDVNPIATINEIKVNPLASTIVNKVSIKPDNVINNTKVTQSSTNDQVDLISTENSIKINPSTTNYKEASNPDVMVVNANKTQLNATKPASVKGDVIVKKQIPLSFDNDIKVVKKAAPLLPVLPEVHLAELAPAATDNVILVNDATQSTIKSNYSNDKNKRKSLENELDAMLADSSLNDDPAVIKTANYFGTNTTRKGAAIDLSGYGVSENTPISKAVNIPLFASRNQDPEGLNVAVIKNHVNLGGKVLIKGLSGASSEKFRVRWGNARARDMANFLYRNGVDLKDMNVVQVKSYPSSNDASGVFISLEG